MKKRLQYLAPGIFLVVFHGVLWAVGVPASYFSLLALAVAFVLLLNVIYSQHQTIERTLDAHRKSLDRETDTYARLRKILNYQTATIAGLQARLYRRNSR